MDAYEIFAQVRHDLGEESESHWKDLAILRKLNMERARIRAQLLLQSGDWGLTSASVTLADSTAELPSDCAKPVYLENSDGYEIPFSATVREKRQDDAASRGFNNTLYRAYLQGNSLYVTQTGVSGTWTLWYYARLGAAAFGVAGASSGASALHFEATQQPSQTDDHYNGLAVFTYDSSTGARKLSTEITDYVGSTLVATITGTPTSGDFYGTELSIPEEAHSLLAQRILLSCLAKPSSALDPKYFEYHAAVLKDLEREWKNFIADRLPGYGAVRITGGLNGY